jgi:hypothetical protein
LAEGSDEVIPAAVVADGKIAGYLLNPHHPEGGPKARYFIACGFRPDEPGPFIEALLEHGEAGNLVRVTHGEFGIKYICEGPLQAPRGATRTVRSVWQKKPEDVWCFLVTAYPF